MGDYLYSHKKSMKAVIEYFDVSIREVESKKQSEKELTGENKDDLFQQLFKKNEQLRYCYGAFYKFKDKSLQNDYNIWLKSPKNNKTQFKLHYGGGVVD